MKQDEQWRPYFAADLPGQNPGWYVAPVGKDGIVCYVERCVDEAIHASLLAAAPELLEACRLMAKEAEEFLDRRPSAALLYVPSPGLNAARAAIAKATGKRDE